MNCNPKELKLEIRVVESTIDHTWYWALHDNDSWFRGQMINEGFAHTKKRAVELATEALEEWAMRFERYAKQA